MFNKKENPSFLEFKHCKANDFTIANGTKKRNQHDHQQIYKE